MKVSPRAHIVTQKHIDFDKDNLAKKLGTTSKGIAPAYADKALRAGIQAKDVLDSKFIWDEVLPQTFLCEGAQGYHLDADAAHYPYVTSSVTLPYAACSLGFAPQYIRDIYGICKAYDTRSGEDPYFPQLSDVSQTLRDIAIEGGEYGVTTGRPRKVNWLNLDMLIDAVRVTGTTKVVANKFDIMKKFEGKDALRMIVDGAEMPFSTIEQMQELIVDKLKQNCPLVNSILFCFSPEDLSGTEILIK